MRVLGIDPSLTSTGLAIIDSDAPPPHGRTERVALPKLRGHERLELILSSIRYHLAHDKPCLAVIEGPSFGSKGASVHQLAGLWWLITHQLYLRHVPYAVVSPQQRAKYATGSGAAGKDAVMLAAAKRYPDVEFAGNDEVDAWILAAMGMRRLGHPIDDLPKTNLAAMAAVTWPELLSDDETLGGAA